MATLTGQTVASTYELLLKVEATGIDASTQRLIEDGNATTSALKLSGAGMTSTGTLTVDGISTLTGAVAAPGGVTGALTGNADTATKAYVTDNESTNEENLISFVADAAVASGNHGLEMDGNLTYNPSSGTLTTTVVASDLTGDVTGDVTGDLTGEVTATGTLADGVRATTQTTGDGSTKIATTAYADAVAPVGTITAYGGASAPTGWLLCNGAVKNSVTDTTLAALYAVIANSFGGSDGTDFLLPDLQGRIPVGRNSTTGTFNVAVGTEAGVEEVTLSGAESGLAAHGHTMYTQTDTHDSPPYHVKGNPPTGGDNDTELSAVYSGDKGVVDAAAAAASSAHTNLQPYLVINYIIKT